MKRRHAGRVWEEKLILYWVFLINQWSFSCLPDPCNYYSFIMLIHHHFFRCGIEGQFSALFLYIKNHILQIFSLRLPFFADPSVHFKLSYICLVGQNSFLLQSFSFLWSFIISKYLDYVHTTFICMIMSRSSLKLNIFLFT